MLGERRTMLFEKIKSHRFEKCYAVEQIWIDNKLYIIAASEQKGFCRMYEADGEFVEDIWSEPGGTMSLVVLREKNGIFLASQMFYGPDNSKESKIVMAKRQTAGVWEISDVTNIAHLHRFDILKSDNQSYFIGCTIKEKTSYANDWRSKGNVYISKIDDDINLKDLHVTGHLLKNHGYYRMGLENKEYALVTGEEGIYKFFPPNALQDDWKMEKVIDDPTSDAIMIDLNNDGVEEIITIAPFHGDEVCIYQKVKQKYKKIYSVKAEFAHGIWAGYIYETPVVIIGHRKGKRNLIMISMSSKVEIQIIDRNVGPANVLCYQNESQMYLVSANCETDELAFYKIGKG